MRWRRHLVAVVAALAAVAAALAVSQPTPVAAATGGTITIVLDANPADGTDVGFTGCQGAGCGPFTLDDDTDPTLPDRVTATGLAPGTYTITQDVVPGWTLTSLTCTSGGATNLATRRATITLTDGKAVTCTFTDQSPSIAIVQDTSPDHGQDMTYTGCLGTGCSTFALDDDADPTLPDTVTGGGLAPGTYTVTQSADATWPLTAVTCNTTTGITTDLPNRQVTIVLSGPSDHRTCTFTDVTQTLTIVEDDLLDTGADLTFTGCLGSGCSTFALDDDAGTDATRTDRLHSGPIPSGTYTVTQDEVPDHRLADLTCPGEAVDLAARRATITLAAGEQATCTFANRAGPPLTGATRIDTGYFATCAVVAGGQARCWGSYALGRPSSAHTTWPVAVLDEGGDGPLTDVADLSVGPAFACAVLGNGQARCWGSGWHGRLGTGSTGDRDLPTPVVAPEGTGPLLGVTQIAAGFTHACGRLTSGHAVCWGDNVDGELGDGTTTPSSVPVVVREASGAPLTGVQRVAAGLGFSCAALAGGEVRCWGDGGSGRLGDGTTAGSLTPVTVVNPEGTGPLTGVIDITARWDHTCARLTDGQARCWGNDQGQLGRPPVIIEPGSGVQPTHRPVVVLDPSGSGPLTGVRHLAAGWYATCAVTEDGRTWCWGDNSYGTIGDGTAGILRYLPTAVGGGTGLPTASDVSVGGIGHACAVLDDGRVRCWGRNLQGQLGDQTLTDRRLPVEVDEP